MKKVVVTKGIFAPLDVFSDALIHGFELLGYQVLIFDKNCIRESVQRIEEYLDKDIIGLVTFNNFATDFTYSTGANVWEKNDIWCINILVDNPLYYHENIKKLPSKSAVLCVDINHMQYVEKYYPGVMVTGMIAHGGAWLYNETKPIISRKIEILYAGSIPTTEYGNFSQYISESITDEAALLETAFQAIYNMMIDNPVMTYEQAVEKYLIANNISYDKELLLNFIQYFLYVEKHVVSYYRVKMIKSIAISGLPITICGGGWDKYDWIKLPNVSYIGVVSATEVIELMADTKIVVNSMPWFKNGSHERVYNAMLQGAVVVTDKSAYFSNIETMIEQIELKDIKNLPAIIEHMLDNPAKMQEKASSAFEYAKKNATWECRAKEISDAFFTVS